MAAAIAVAMASAGALDPALALSLAAAAATPASSLKCSEDARSFASAYTALIFSLSTSFSFFSAAFLFALAAL